VLDIVTKSGFNMRETGTLTVSGGEAGRVRAAGDVGGHRERVGYYVYGSMFSLDRFLSPPAPESIHNSGKAGHVFGQLDWNLGQAGSLRAVLMGDAANFEIPKTPTDVELRPLANADQRTRQQTATVGWTRASSNVAVGATLYQRWSRSELLPATGPLTAQAAVERELSTIGGKLDVTRFAGRHAFKAGVDAVRLAPREDLSYLYTGYRDLTHLLDLPHPHVTGGAITFAGRETGGEISGYVQDGIRLGDRVTANIGVRLDRYDLVVSATHASPRLSLAYRLGDSTTVHASYNHFFVPPPAEGVLSSSAGLTRSFGEINAALPALEPTIEDQVELGVTVPTRPVRLAFTGYYRASDNPIHSTVWLDSRIYSYASFDRARAYGLEAKAELPMMSRFGVTGYVNYALGRVNFYNPVTGGFTTELEHLTETSRFLAPMDQTHTLTGGATYRHGRTGLFLGAWVEYGSGTPTAHGEEEHHKGGDDEHEEDHGEGEAAGTARVPGHVTANISFGVDLLRRSAGRSRLSLQVDIENITDNLYLIADEGGFSRAQYSIPRLISVTAKLRF
jgi:outer membrane receptor protein involved in Fe transport